MNGGLRDDALRAARVARRALLRGMHRRRQHRPLDDRRQRFLSEERLVYDFERFPRQQYVTEREWAALHPLNGDAGHMVDNKGLIPAVSTSIDDLLPLPTLYVSGERALSWDAPEKTIWAERSSALAAASDRLGSEGALFFRPIGQSGGFGAAVVHDGHALAVLSRRHARFVLTPHLRPAAYSAAIWPDALNTIRVSAFRPPDGAPAVLRLAHRFGRAGTGPVDNRKAGGVTCSIDATTGRMGQPHYMEFAAGRPTAWTATAVHPNSGAPIQGVAIPGWPVVRAQIQRLVDAFPFLRVAGFDVAPTPSGLKLIEVNSLPSVVIAQADEPLLIDPDIRALFTLLRS